MVAQQMMARWLLERPGHPAHEVVKLAHEQFPELNRDVMSTVFEFMASKGILFEHDGLASMGIKGEKLFGRAHFLDLLSAFASPMVLAARHGVVSLVRLTPPLCSNPRKDRPCSCWEDGIGKSRRLPGRSGLFGSNERLIRENRAGWGRLDG